MSIQLGTTLYSLTNEFHSLDYSFEQLLAELGRREIGPGVELVGFQSIRGFPLVSSEFELRFKTLIDRHGLVPSCLAINADVNIRRGHPMSIDDSVVYHEAQIKAAAQLGFPVARCQFPAGPAVLERLEPIAAALQVKLGIEIHAPATLESPEVLPYRELYSRLASPWLGFVPDFGSTSRAIPPTVTHSFLNDGISPDAVQLALHHWASAGSGEQRMQTFAAAAAEAGIAEATIGRLMLMFMMFGRMEPEAWAEIMPQVVHVHGKFFDFDAAGDELAVDQRRTLRVFLDAGYDGSMSSEYEGHHFSDEGGFDKIERHHALCRRIIDDHRPAA